MSAPKPENPPHLWLPEKHRLPENIAQKAEEYGIIPTFRQPESGFFLAYIQNKISLIQSGKKASIDVDFTEGKIAHRLRFGGKELLARAINTHAHHTVWDGTAGLGQDAFVLAALGAQVDLFERHPLICLMLADGLYRAQAYPETTAIAQRMTLHFGTFTTPFRQPEQKPQVIYLDPMFPERKKSAAVNQAMQYFQAAIGEDADASDFLHQARQRAQKRIVLKRPKWAKSLTDEAPAYSYSGKNTRFDVYLPI